MKICMLLNASYPDIRVKKEISSLLKEGHEIYLVSLGVKRCSQRPLMEAIHFNSVSSRGALSSFYSKIRYTLSFIHQEFLWAAISVIRKNSIDILHVHDLPLVKTALYLGKKFNIPVISDLHENYPAAVEVWRSSLGTVKKMKALIVPIWRLKKLERYCVRNSNYVITVVEEARQHYINDCGKESDRVVVVSNTVDLDFFDSAKLEEIGFEDEFIILYIGGVSFHRGVDIAIKALPQILKVIPNARLLIVGGKRNNYERYLSSLSEKLGVAEKVSIFSWVDLDMVPSYIAGSDICLVPHRVNTHTNTTIPHKLFQYMAMSKPVIVSDAKPLRRIVNECECGLIFRNEDSEQLAEEVIMLYENRQLSHKLGRNGRKAVERKYNWKIDSQKLITIYEDLK